VRLSIALALLVAGVLAQGAPVAANEQAVEILTPPAEQRIHALDAGGQVQRVEVVGGGEQSVAAHEPPSPSAKAASRAGKFVLGVASAALALGAMAASLLLL
jgi:hypothetical protein